MNFDQTRFAAVVAAAKQKAANRPQWRRAIEKAAAAILDGSMIVTTLAHGALVTTLGGTYACNGACPCPARTKHCYHRAGVRLVEMMEASPVIPVRAPRIVRSVESDHTGQRYPVTYCDGWAI